MFRIFSTLLWSLQFSKQYKFLERLMGNFSLESPDPSIKYISSHTIVLIKVVVKAQLFSALLFKTTGLWDFSMTIKPIFSDTPALKQEVNALIWGVSFLSFALETVSCNWLCLVSNSENSTLMSFKISFRANEHIFSIISWIFSFNHFKSSWPVLHETWSIIKPNYFLNPSNHRD